LPPSEYNKFILGKEKALPPALKNFTHFHKKGIITNKKDMERYFLAQKMASKVVRGEGGYMDVGRHKYTKNLFLTSAVERERKKN